MPIRIQRKRTKGWRMPEGAVYVGRPSRFGNPFTGDKAVALFRRWLTGALSQREFIQRKDDGSWALYSDRKLIAHEIEKLRGKDLTCWCPLDQPCHADVLLDLANK